MVGCARKKIKEKNCFKFVAFLGEPSPDRFEAVIHSIGEGVFTVYREWRITCFNRSAEENTCIPDLNKKLMVQRIANMAQKRISWISQHWLGVFNVLRGTRIVFKGGRFIVTKRIVSGGSTFLKANDPLKKGELKWTRSLSSAVVLKKMKD